ncbi:hypothetical protein ACTXT7_002305 [Hymenolepis weldensis]
MLISGVRIHKIDVHQGTSSVKNGQPHWSTRHSQGNEDSGGRTTQVITLPQTTHLPQPNEEKKSKSRRSLVSLCRPFKRLTQAIRSESCSVMKAEISSSDSSKHHENPNNKLPKLKEHGKPQNRATEAKKSKKSPTDDQFYSGCFCDMLDPISHHYHRKGIL